MSGLVLALDTSTGATAAAVLLEDRCVERRVEAGSGRPAHAKALLPLAADCLAAFGRDFEDVDTVAVGVGPGSFTGIRAGVAAASGLARGCGAELVGVGSLRALLAAARAAGIEGPVVAAIDARRGELFVSVERAEAAPDAGTVLPLSGIGDFGVGGQTWVGDGALLARESLEAHGAVVPPVGDSCHCVPAAAIARLAADPDSRGEEVLPVYLRKPDAVPAGGA